MVHLLAVMLIVSLSLNKVEANWEEIEQSGTQKTPDIDVKDKAASIQLKTGAKLGQDPETQLLVTFFDDEGEKRDLWVYFRYSLQYYIEGCSPRSLEFTNVPSDDEKVWTIVYNGPNEGGERLTVHINDVEVMNFLISADTCGASWKGLTLKTEVSTIQIRSRYTIIDGYRLTPQEDEDTGNEEGGDMGHYSHAFNCKASGIVFASFLCVLNLII